MVRQGKRSMKNVMPPASPIYIGSCRLSSLFRKRFRGKHASVAAFSRPRQSSCVRRACWIMS